MKIFLIVLASVAAFLAICLCVFLILIRPSAKKREVMKRYKGVKFAHRGLHDSEKAENSMSAFAAAVEHGYAIELDVRLSKDGELVVFHDDTLDRMTEAVGRVDSFTVEELSRLHLGGTDDCVPTFRDVLKLVDGRVPLLVEMKEDIGKYGVTKKTAEMLKEYHNLSGIYLTASGVEGVCRVLKQLDMIGKVKVISNDLTPVNMYELQNGSIQFLIGQNAYAQGYEPIMILFNKLFDGKEPEKEFAYTEIVVKTKYN